MIGRFLLLLLFFSMRARSVSKRNERFESDRVSDDTRALITFILVLCSVHARIHAHHAHPGVIYAAGEWGRGGGRRLFLDHRAGE